nr:immunoglobulin heavy chain junction region [Homo sapiens]
CARARGFFW